MPASAEAASANPGCVVRTDPFPEPGKKIADSPKVAWNKGVFSALRICQSTHGVWGMSPGEAAASYRLYAAYCAEFAQQVPDPLRKVALLDMAQAWVRLAEHADKGRPPDQAENP